MQVYLNYLEGRQIYETDRKYVWERKLLRGGEESQYHNVFDLKLRWRERGAKGDIDAAQSKHKTKTTS